MAAQTGDVGAEQDFQGARAWDRQCHSLVEEEARYLGQGITSIIHRFNSKRVVMGGGLSQAFDLLEPGIRTAIRSDVMGPFKDVKVVPAALGGNARLIGAVAMMHEHLDT